ncbi:MAG: hypothetical protein MK089_01255 [Phycisphaerales bacterium]|nr:hypothetical protein [Phycisphaerales bacterium]
MSTIEPPVLAADQRESGWRAWLSIPQDRFNKPWMVFLLIIIAWSFCVLIRYQWIVWAEGVEQFNWVGGVQPTTHDAFTHGAVLQQHLEGRHSDNPHMPPLFNGQGAIHSLIWLFLQIIPVSIPKLLIWAPVFVSSLIVIPYILIGRLYGSALWGFAAAMIGGIAWNFYERSMAGYFDTDMISFGYIVLLLFLFMASHVRRSVNYAGLAAFATFLYPYFYYKGMVIGTSLAACFIGLQILHALIRSDWDRRLRLIALVATGIAASPWSSGRVMHATPWWFFIGLMGIIAAWLFFVRYQSSSGTEAGRSSVHATSNRVDKGRFKILLMATGVCVLWFVLTMPWGFFAKQVEGYSHLLMGTEQAQSQVELDPLAVKVADIRDEINFRKTHKHTILESQPEQVGNLMRRMTGSITGTLLAAIGYLLICIRYPAFLIAAPLAGIGLFSLDGGLRFTTWGGLLGAITLPYFIFIAVQALLRLLPDLSLNALRSGALIGGLLICIPFVGVNAVHAMTFKVGTVFNAQAIEAMQAIKKYSSPGDYVIAWWDYGSGLWYYADRNVLMTPIKVTDDCWTVSNIVSSDSQQVAAGLARLAAEASESGKLPASHRFLGLDTDSPMTPAELLDQLRDGELDLPKPTREVFLYLPVDMLRLAGVIEAYANPLYNLPSHPEAGFFHGFTANDIQEVAPGVIAFPNGVHLTMKNGQAFVMDGSGNQIPLRLNSTMIVRELADGSSQVTKLPQPIMGMKLISEKGNRNFKLADPDYEPGPNERWLHFVILDSVGMFMFMDDDFYNSNIIQMVAMQNYDRNIWELVSKNAYARTFRLKDTDSLTWQPGLMGEPPAMDVIAD